MFAKFWQNSSKFLEKNAILEQCKGVHCVDLGESFQTHIFLQNFVSIQPRTSPVKFARSSGAATTMPSSQGCEPADLATAREHRGDQLLSAEARLESPSPR